MVNRNTGNLWDIPFRLIEQIVDEANGRGRYPKADVYLKDGNYFINLEMPGVKKENIEITLNEGILLVEGKVDSINSGDAKVLLRERPTTKFVRSFDVNPNLQSEQVTALCDSGILRLTFPESIEVKKENKSKIQVK